MALLRRLGTRPAIVLAPLAPWVAALPALAIGLIDPAARQQLRAATLPVFLYLLGWSLAATAGVLIWQRLGLRAPSGSLTGGDEGRKTKDESPPDTFVLRPSSFVPEGKRLTGPAALSIAVPLLAFAALVYWNNAVLDPLQARGFPDYVTQMKGARKLLAGALPYDPTIRVWTDVNLPPITLLLLFAPFAPFSDLGGKLAYFALNHAAFFAGLIVLLAATHPPARGVSPAAGRGP